MSNKNTHNPFKGALVGLVAGAVAGTVMDGYWAVLKNLSGGEEEQKEDKSEKKDDEPSTQIVADNVSKAVTGKEVPKKDKEKAGMGVHYATSLTCGALFGIAASRLPRLGPIAGALYGAAIWAILDEAILKALNIGPPADEVPMAEHMQALGAHLVYGASTGITTRLLMR